MRCSLTKYDNFVLDEMLPDWLPQTLWDEFKKHRQKIKTPMTPYAETLILVKLDHWKADGADAIAILNESIERGWAGVFNRHAAPQAGRLDSGSPLKEGRHAGPVVCCMCGLSLTSGFVYSSKGRKCHNC